MFDIDIEERVERGVPGGETSKLCVEICQLAASIQAVFINKSETSNYKKLGNSVLRSLIIHQQLYKLSKTLNPTRN